MSAPGCTSGTFVFSACPTDGEGHLAVEDECCPCPTPEGCEVLYYSKGLTPPPVPAWCCEKYASLPDPLPACGEGGVNGMVACAGPCVPAAPDGWTGPELVYNGPGLFSPSCPNEAPVIAFEGAPEPVVEPHTCPSCTCATPVGACKLPETWTVRSEPCNLGGIETPFDPPVGWDGTCSADDTIPAGQLCGGKPCVLSLTVSPPVLEEQPCEVLTQCPDVPNQDPPKVGGQAAESVKPNAPPPAPPEPPTCAPPASSEPWTQMLALACATDGAWPACVQDSSKLCVPTAGDFDACVRKVGDEECPEGWPVRHLVYDNVEVERSCSPCSCGAPAGGECIVEAAVTSGNACGGLEWQLNVSSAELSKCVDLMSGVALASKQAALLSYQPSTCEPSGGAPLVTVTLGVPMTLCCRAQP